MKKKFFKSRRLFAIAVFSYILFLFFFPSVCIGAARNGLLLWFEQLLPSLLPFLIMSGLCVSFGLTSIIGKLFYPFLRFLPISRQGCYPIIIGLLSGYPVGARACADLLSEGKLSRQEANYLFCFCNNASPMFLTGYTACSCLGIERFRYIFLLLISLSGLAAATLIYPLLSAQLADTSASKYQNNAAKPFLSENNIKTEQTKNTAADSVTKKTPRKSAMQKLDEVILSSFEIMVKVGGYVILFSIPASLLKHFTASMNSACVWFLPLLSGILEISTGVSELGSAALPFCIKIILTLAVCAFGGLSALAQTKSVIGSSGLSIKYYIICKILQACIAAAAGQIVFYIIIHMRFL